MNNIMGPPPPHNNSNNTGSNNNMHPPPPGQPAAPSRHPPPGPPPPPPPPPKIPTVPVSIFDENHLPSVLHQPNPMTPEAERQARRRTIRFIEEAGQRSLRMPRVAVSTATVFFHQFYAKHAFQEHDRFEVAMACLLLAGKTEESPKKLDFVIRECWKLRRRAQQQQQQRQLSQDSGAGGDSPASFAGTSPTTAVMGGSPSPSGTDPNNIDPKSEEYIRLKERVLLLERVILHTIGFELSIDHPYKFLVDCVQSMNKKRLLEYVKPPNGGNGKDGQPLSKNALHSQMVQDLAQNAMNFGKGINYLYILHNMLCAMY